MNQRQVSTTNYPILIYMVLSADGLPATGITLTVTLSKNGAAFGAAAGAVAEIGNGWYSLAGNATDRNTLGSLAVRATGAGCVDFAGLYEVVTDDPFAANGGMPNLDAAVSSRLADADYTAPDNAGITANGVAIAGIDTKLGTPAGVSVSADIAALDGSLDIVGTGVAAVIVSSNAIKAKTDQLTFTVPGSVDATANVDPELIGEAVWGAPVRSLTQTAQEIVAILEGSSITALRGDEWSVALTNLGVLTGQTKLWFTARRDKDAADAASQLQIVAGTGITYLNGAAPQAPIVAGDGSLTIDDEATGDITLVLKGRASKELAPETIFYDIQYLDADGQPHTLTSGQLTIVGDVTRAVS